jgi:predicted RNA binding protein with dsRBD fold (UPF0201 family)
VYSVDVEIRAPVHATEVDRRVADAIRAVFPDTTPEKRGGEGDAPDEMRARTHALDELADRLRERGITDAARGQLRDATDGDRISFRLAKQAAFAGTATFAVDRAELGDITVEVRVHDPTAEALVDRLAPPTDDGPSHDGSV